MLLIDDHSKDEGPALIHAFPDFRFRLKVFQNGEKEQGKKAAIRKGTAEAENDFLLFTDADCRISPFWIEKMVWTQFHSQAEMVCGPVKIKTHAFWQKLEMLETAALMATASLGILINRPNFCNAANLLIRRKTFLDLKTNRKDEHLPSGDDVFLLHTLHEKKATVAYCLLENAAVETEAQPSLSALINQRTRWAGKWNTGLSGSNGKMALAAWAFHLSYLCLLFFLALFGQRMALAGLYLLKNTAEALFLQSFCFHTGYRSNSLKVALFQIPYSLFVLFMGIKVALSPAYTWKGRRVTQ